MNWLEEIESELRRSIPNENPGRTRTIARRAAGIALQKFYRKTNANFYALVLSAVNDEQFPEEVRAAAARLSRRISDNFEAASVAPLHDAKIIIAFVKENIQSNG